MYKEKGEPDRFEDVWTIFSGESVPENETTAAPEKRADATSPAVATGMRTITENAAGRGTAIVRGTVTETVRERGRGSIDTAR